ncbi:MAG TPA: RNA polymerase sigma factor [Pirellulales bacterium]|nr:RNA polymerase sigma factor [Pirellulales bacterium]
MVTDAASSGTAPSGGSGPSQGTAPSSEAVTPAGLDAARLIKEHQAGVWRYLRVLGCSANQAEDLTQETFLAVLQKPFQEINRAATAAYLRQVARNLFISSQRRAARGVAMAELDEIEAAWGRWAANDDGRELLVALQKCLETLADKARQALELRFREKQSRAAIAAALGMSEDGAKNLMQRAKQHLRTCIERSLRC